MSLLTSLKKRNLPPFDQLSLDQLPSTIREKVYLIVRFIDQAILFSTAEQSSPENNSEELEELYKSIDNAFRPFAGIGVAADFDLDLLKLMYRMEAESEVMADIYSKDKDLYLNIIENNLSKEKQSNQDYGLSFIEAIESMGKPEYEPGTDLSNLVKMLQNLFVYWVNWPRSRLINLIAEADPKPQRPTIESDSVKKIAEMLDKETFLDLSLAKIAHRVGLVVDDIHQWGRREKRRTLKGAKAKQEIKAINAKPVIETFYSLKFPKEVFPKGASLHKVAGMIENILKDKIKPPPSIFTIKRVLKNDGEIWKQFKVKGRNYIIKQT